MGVFLFKVGNRQSLCRGRRSVSGCRSSQGGEVRSDFGGRAVEAQTDTGTDTEMGRQLPNRVVDLGQIDDNDKKWERSKELGDVCCCGCKCAQEGEKRKDDESERDNVTMSLSRARCLWLLEVGAWTWVAWLVRVGCGCGCRCGCGGLWFLSCGLVVARSSG